MSCRDVRCFIRGGKSPKIFAPSARFPLRNHLFVLSNSQKFRAFGAFPPLKMPLVGQRFGIGEMMKNIGPVSDGDKNKKINEKKYVTASMKGLECSKLSKNIMNGKSYLFYIEAIPNFFFQLEKMKS